jgi:hypothetical protein
MSTEIATASSTGIAIPSRSERAAALAQRVRATSNIIKISTDGKHLVIPGLGEAPAPADLVVLEFMAKNVYYDPNKPYDPNNISGPLCAAMGFDLNDNLKPFDNATDKQAESCKECPLNQFGSKGAGKACQNRRLVAVLPPDASADTDIYVLDVSATGIKGFDTIIAQMATVAGKEPHYFKVEVFPKQAANSRAQTWGFSNPRPLSEEAIAIMESKLDAAAAQLAQPVSFE